MTGKTGVPRCHMASFYSHKTTLYKHYSKDVDKLDCHICKKKFRAHQGHPIEDESKRHAFCDLLVMQDTGWLQNSHAIAEDPNRLDI